MNDVPASLRLIVLAALAGLCLTSANGAAFIGVSNLGAAVSGSAAVSDENISGTRLGSNLAQAFTTGATPTILDSVTLDMDSAVIAGGEFSVALFSDIGGFPSTRLADLSGETSPVNAGLYSYVPPNNTGLAAGTTYWIVASVPHEGPLDRAYRWTTTVDPGETGLPGWTLGPYQSRGYTDGVADVSWVVPGPGSLKMEVAVVPEPAACATWSALVFLGGAAWLKRGRRLGIQFLV